MKRLPWKWGGLWRVSNEGEVPEDSSVATEIQRTKGRWARHGIMAEMCVFIEKQFLQINAFVVYITIYDSQEMNYVWTHHTSRNFATLPKNATKPMPNWDISFRFLNINTFEKNIALQNFEKSTFTLVWKSYVHVQAHKNLQLSLQAWVLKHRYCKCANLHWYCFSVFQPIGGTDSKTTFICSTLQMEGQSAWGWRKSGKHVRTSENVVMKLSRERLLCQTVQWQHNGGGERGGGSHLKNC